MPKEKYVFHDLDGSPDDQQLSAEEEQLLMEELEEDEDIEFTQFDDEDLELADSKKKPEEDEEEDEDSELYEEEEEGEDEEDDDSDDDDDEYPELSQYPKDVRKIIAQERERAQQAINEERQRTQSLYNEQIEYMKTSRKEAYEADYWQFKMLKTNADEKISKIKQDIRAAKEDGDVQKETDLQEALQKAVYDSRKYDDQISRYEDGSGKLVEYDPNRDTYLQNLQKKANEAGSAGSTQPTGDKATKDKLVRQWLYNNRDWIHDPDLADMNINGIIESADKAAYEKGMKPTDPEYYNEMNRYIQGKLPDTETKPAVEVKKKPVKKRVKKSKKDVKRREKPKTPVLGMNDLPSTRNKKSLPKKGVITAGEKAFMRDVMGTPLDTPEAQKEYLINKMQSEKS